MLSDNGNCRAGNGTRIETISTRLQRLPGLTAGFSCCQTRLCGPTSRLLWMSVDCGLMFGLAVKADLPANDIATTNDRIKNIARNPSKTPFATSTIFDLCVIYNFILTYILLREK